MKSKTLPAAAAVIAGLLVWLAARSEAQDAPNTREVMKLKLSYAQNVLEGITTENTDLIVANAQKLSALSKAAGWRARETPEYELFSAEFRLHSDAVARAAKDKNIDAASLAYFQMTISCINCHRYMRDVRRAGL